LYKKQEDYPLPSIKFSAPACIGFYPITPFPFGSYFQPFSYFENSDNIFSPLFSLENFYSNFFPENTAIDDNPFSFGNLFPFDNFNSGYNYFNMPSPNQCFMWEFNF